MSCLSGVLLLSVLPGAYHGPSCLLRLAASIVNVYGSPVEDKEKKGIYHLPNHAGSSSPAGSFGMLLLTKKSVVVCSVDFEQWDFPRQWEREKLEKEKEMKLDNEMKLKIEAQKRDHQGRKELRIEKSQELRDNLDEMKKNHKKKKEEWFQKRTEALKVRDLCKERLGHPGEFEGYLNRHKVICDGQEVEGMVSVAFLKASFLDQRPVSILSF